MAQPVASGELGSWRGENVRLGQVIDALSELRRAEQGTATRASVTNLVLIAADDDELEQACGAVHRLGRRHPGRNIVVLPRPGAEPDGVDASVMLHGSVAEGHPVWSEDIRLDVRGAPARHLESLVEPLTLPDLPVVVWFVRGLPDPDEPLLRSASAVLVDSGNGDDAPLAALARLYRRRVVLDLAWARLRPCRQLLAAQFEVAAARPYVRGVSEVSIEGPLASRLLLAGWLMSRLALPPSAVDLGDAPVLAVRLGATSAGAPATFAVREEVGPGGTVLVATAAIDGGRERVERLAVPEDPSAWSLGESLTRVGRDRVYGQALQAALVFGG